MHTIDIRQLYDCDPRPTFIVDCEVEPAAIYHVNAALLGIQQLALSLHSHDTLRDWWDPRSKVASRQQSHFRHGRHRWTKFSPCQRWLVVTLVEQPGPSPISEAHGYLSQSAQLHSRSGSAQYRPDNIFTVKIQSPELQSHVNRLHTVDWAATSLGPMNAWSHELNQLVTTLMLETRPTALFLGADHVIIYNLAYAAVSGSRHPKILGKSIIDAW
jgi:hypothetical protein